MCDVLALALALALNLTLTLPLTLTLSAGQVSITLGDEHDTNKSSYLLNLFTSEEHALYIDVDAARAGNEVRLG